MKNKLPLIAILILIMGLFSFLKKSDDNPPEASSTILGMVLLEEADSLNMDGVISDLENKWKLKIDSKEIGEEASVIEINGYTIAIGNMSVPIPGDEIKETAEYSYFWKNGVEEATKHQGHVIVSIMNTGKNPIKENILFSQIASSMLANSQSLGIYIGERTLLLQKEFYIENVQSMSEDDLPLYIWIYFGLRQEGRKQSIFTYGLNDFGKKEMEIVNSRKSFDDLSSMMFNLTHYILASDVVLQNGETIGVSAEQKLRISESKGIFLDGRTLKINY